MPNKENRFAVTRDTFTRSAGTSISPEDGQGHASEVRRPDAFERALALLIVPELRGGNPSAISSDPGGHVVQSNQAFRVQVRRLAQDHTVKNASSDR